MPGTYVDVRTVAADRYAASLDSSKPTLIKIDVEGYEVQVLQGIRSLLSWPEVLLVTEVGEAMLKRAGHSSDELHAVLASHGFRPFRFDIRSSRWAKVLELRHWTVRWQSTNTTSCLPAPRQRCIAIESSLCLSGEWKES